MTPESRIDAIKKKNPLEENGNFGSMALGNLGGVNPVSPFGGQFGGIQSLGDTKNPKQIGEGDRTGKNTMQTGSADTVQMADLSGGPNVDGFEKSGGTESFGMANLDLGMKTSTDVFGWSGNPDFSSSSSNKAQAKDPLKGMSETALGWGGTKSIGALIKEQKEKGVQPPVQEAVKPSDINNERQQMAANNDSVGTASSSIDEKSTQGAVSSNIAASGKSTEVATAIGVAKPTESSNSNTVSDNTDSTSEGGDGKQSGGVISTETPDPTAMAANQKPEAPVYGQEFVNNTENTQRENGGDDAKVGNLAAGNIQTSGVTISGGSGNTEELAFENTFENIDTTSFQSDIQYSDDLFKKKNPSGQNFMVG